MYVFFISTIATCINDVVCNAAGSENSSDVNWKIFTGWKKK